MISRPRLLLAALALAGIVLAAVASPRTAGALELRKSVITGGGASLQGGDYILHGTVGQAATTRSTGAGFKLHGGFWQGMPQDVLFDNGFE